MPVTLSVERQTLCLESDTIGIGRSPDNLVVFQNDDRVAPLHAVLKCVNGRWIIESRDGGPIRIGNGRPTQFAWVSPGDVIRLTETGPELIFEPTPASSTTRISGADAQEAVIAAPESFLNPSRAAVPLSRPLTGPSRDSASVSKDMGTALKGGGAGSPSPAATSASVENRSAAGRNPLIIWATSALTVVLVVSVLAIWMLKPREPETEPIPKTVAENDAPNPGENRPAPVPDPPPLALPPAPAKISLEPQEFLVLVGIGDLTNDDRPHVVSVGWLWDKQTAVVSRHVGIEIERFEADAKRGGQLARGWVIQGPSLGIDHISHPPDCRGISILRLKTPAGLQMDAREQWQRVNHDDVEKKRMRGKAIRYCSYDRLPRPDSVKGNHGFPLCEYDPEKCRQNRGVAHLLVNAQTHYLESTDTPLPLERGGLLIDEDGKIMGMVLDDSSILWTETLERVLAAR